MLPKVKIFLGKDILQALMINVDLALGPHYIMPPYLESMHYGCQLQVMRGVAQLMFPQLARRICNGMPFLHIITPSSGGKTECITYMGQDPFSPHMLTSQV
jgi:hypothetical protein